MALTGFGLSTDQEKVKSKQKSKHEHNKDVASASVLHVLREDKKVNTECIFCKSTHDCQNCESARTLTLEERKEIAKKNNSCFKCLKRNHLAKFCRSSVKCGWCNKKHVLLMCPSISGKDIEFKPVNKQQITENNLVSSCKQPDVCLQTLRVTLYSFDKEKTVRVLIDTGSQRSYIRSDLARELGYVARGKHEVKHLLFGGLESECEKHNIYQVRVKSLCNSYACNFEAMDQKIICANVSSVNDFNFGNELSAENIILIDIGDEINSIDLLIGADVAGKLLTGKKLDLKNGLTAIETRLG